MSNAGLTQRKGRTPITAENENASYSDFSTSNSHSPNNKKEQQSIQQKRVWTWVILFALFLLGGLIYVDQLSHLDFGMGIIGTSGPNPNHPSRTNMAVSSHSKSHPMTTTTSSSNQIHIDSPYWNESFRNKDDGILYHLIFSTDCSGFQHWQSYLMFHSAYKVSQPGTITRIASGCTDEEAEKAKQWHKEHITDVMGPRFMLFLTPHFSGVKDKDGNTVGDYKFFNKPFGLKYWLQNAIPTTDKQDENQKTPLLNENDIVILIDPDMLLLRPITGDFSKDRDVVIGPRHNKDRKYKVEHGSPFAQKYGLGTQWRTFNLKEITQDERSPAIQVSQGDGGTFYPVGAPYIATVRDMYQIALKWSEFVPRVHAEYPYLLAEMFAYCIAAAHLKLPHMLIDSMMVSNTGAGGEGWPMVDAMETKGLCAFAKHPDHSQQPVPSLIHYCQRYALGSWFFSKRKMVTNFFECKSPFMEEPPDTLVEETDWAIPYGGNRKSLSPTMAKREGFAVCTLLSALNDASAFFKKHHCGNKANMEKTLNLNWKNNKAA